jgi:pimeloyl-ACP methyl ester carboxylesterase
MTTFVVAHGAWSAGWAWKKMHPLMRALGHTLITPTYTGIGERSHLAHAGIDLETHITDILNVLDFEDLRDVILIGHSYGGMVATGVADRAAERIAHLVYLDAFAPRHGDSLLSLTPADNRSRVLEGVRTQGDGWRIPANPLPSDTSPEDVAWSMARRVMQPLKTWEQPIQLTGAGDALPKSYIYCNKFGPGDVFHQFADRARGEAGWTYFGMDASHNPHITVPGELAALLDGIARGSAKA